MRLRGLLLVVLILAVLAVLGLGYLGLNPPDPAPKPVQKTLPNDKFQVR